MRECSCPGDYTNGYGMGGKHSAFCDSLPNPYRVPLNKYCHDCEASFETWDPEQKLCPRCIEHYARAQQEQQ